MRITPGTLKLWSLSVIWFTFSDLSYLTWGSPISANIPENLKECYNNPYILTKDNLLPMTTTTLIALVRKLEDQLGGNMDMRVLAPAILARFRFDGIERNPNVLPSPSVIPYALTGTEFFLFQTIFQQILPSTGGNIPNETLTYLERCTFHWLLSDSIDVWDRGDSDAPCSKLSKLTAYNFRVPRALREDAEMLDAYYGPQSRIMYGPSKGKFQQMFPQQVSHPETMCPMENGVIYNEFGATTAGIVLAGISAGLNFQRVPPRNMYRAQPRSGLRKKPRPPQPTSWPGYGGARPRAFGNWQDSNPNQGGQGGQGGQGYNPNYGQGPGYGPGPNFGGQGPNYGPGPNFGPGPNYGPPPVDIDNRYAATLAGSLAHVALLLGPEQGSSMQIGTDGGWNNTMVPKYYFLKNYFKNALTDARIRGSLDGLILADSVQNWVNSGRGNLKLSQVLSMFYSRKGVLSTEVKSCNRKNLLMKFSSELTDQTYAMAEVLKDDLPSSVTVLDEAVHQYASIAAQNLKSYVPSLRDKMCTNDGNQPLIMSPLADLTVVLDCTWDYQDISSVLQYVVDRIDLRKYGSNFTLINGKDGRVMIESINSPLDFGNDFNRTYYKSVAMGFDFPKVMSELKQRFRMKEEVDKMQNSPGGYPRVVTVIPFQATSMSDGDKNSARNTLQYFRENIPDVQFLYLISGSKERFTPFADNPDKDIIMLTGGSIPDQLDLLVKRISQTPRRIINPTCGKLWTGYWYNEVRLNGYLDPGEVHFYRVHQNYFFRGANAIITISTEGSAPTLTVCTSRVNSLPIANLSKTNDVSCKQITGGNKVSYTLKDECSSYYYAFQCNPFYISVTNTQIQQATQIQMNCNDQECRDPDMTKYTISHQGLSCYSSVSRILALPGLLIAALIVNVFKIV